MLIGNYLKNIDLKFKDHFFSGLSFNSFECKKNDIFFAIKGSLIDGTKYIKSAINQGARTIVYDENFEGLKDGVLYIKSRNVRKTLSKISYKFYFQRPRNNECTSFAGRYFNSTRLFKTDSMCLTYPASAPIIT